MGRRDVMHITCVTFDCHDPVVVAHFWNEVLHWGGVTVSESGNGATCHPTEGGTYLEFVRVPERKSGKNRLHLGCGLDSPDDFDAELARLQALGATIAWEEEFPPEIAARYRNVILRDVEGKLLLPGDYVAPRGVEQAVYEGHKVGMAQ